MIHKRFHERRKKREFELIKPRREFQMGKEEINATYLVPLDAFGGHAMGSVALRARGNARREW